MFNGLKLVLIFIFFSGFSYSQNNEKPASDTIAATVIFDSISTQKISDTIPAGNESSSAPTQIDSISTQQPADTIPDTIENSSIQNQADSISTNNQSTNEISNNPITPVVESPPVVESTPTVESAATLPAQKENKKEEFIFKPTIGIGTGMFSFYGDVYNKHFQAPMVSRIGYDLSIGQKLTDYLQFNFYVLSGKLGANERFTPSNRNLNFESQILAGGLNLLYNFGNFLPKDRTLSPYISLGIESLEFLTKTDLYDKYGNKYYYWSDGTTRNLSENDANAKNAILIHRDYTYESDVRELNADGFGKYPERSWAIPVGAGIIFNINNYLDFKMGATMHFTFTDYIDGITAKSIGNRVGNSKNDNYLMTSFSVHYNFGSKNSDANSDEDIYEGVDFLALENNDDDVDGVPDLKDSCQGTPAGVPVDLRGCPLDDDNDEVANYKDDELTSPEGAFVDEKGVQLSDSLIAYKYNFYMDSTGAFSKVEVHDHNGNIRYSMQDQKEFTVELGKFKKGLSPEIMTKFLSINDITSGSIDDSTSIYTAGKFYGYADAEKRKQQLVNEGFTDAKVVYKQNGKYFEATGYTQNNTGTVTPVNKDNEVAVKAISEGNITANYDNVVFNAPGTVLRIQLGAFQKRISKNVFKGMKDVIEIKTDDGLFKYLSGSFTNIEDAAKYKVETLLKGYQGAFIIAYKDGKRISLKEAGATAQSKKEELSESPDSSSTNSVDKILITFKVQVGLFKNDPPDEKLEIYAKIKGITGESSPSGLKRYVVGSFNDYKSADALKNEIIKNYGIADAFVIAFFNNEYISVQEAMELLK